MDQAYKHILMNPVTSNISEVKKQTFPFYQVSSSCLAIKKAFKQTNENPFLEFFAVPKYFIALPGF